MLKRLTRKRQKVNEYQDWLEVLGPTWFTLCLEQLDLLSLSSCARVCKAWNEVTNAEALWASLLRRNFPSEPKNPISNKAQYQSALRRQEEEIERIVKELEKRHRVLSERKVVFRMFHPSNGRYNFLPYTPSVPFEEMPDRQTLVKILMRDNELRLSKGVQEEYWISDYPGAITLAVQTQAVSEFGFSNPWIIPSALTYYKDDEEIRNIPHYVKYNRSQQGKLIAGDAIPGIPLSTIQGCATSLRKLLEPHAAAPVVLVAGSYT